MLGILFLKIKLIDKINGSYVRPVNIDIPNYTYRLLIICNFYIILKYIFYLKYVKRYYTTNWTSYYMQLL